MKNITHFLWFDNNAEEAVNFYTSTFENSKIGKILRYDDAGAKASGKPIGSAMTVPFEISGQKFTALNGVPIFKFTPAISFFIYSKTEKECDRLWETLSENGNVLMEYGKYPFSDKYGWLNDKFGLSWQVFLTPNDLAQRIIPSLMFVGNKYGKAEEAMNFYTSVFKNSQIDTIYRYGANQKTDGENNIAYADFTLSGHKFAVMESALEHKFNFNESISFAINCENQDEVDYFWNKLSDVPQAEQCGWLKDKYGVSWQIVPIVLFELLQDKDAQKSQRVMQAMLQMKKIDIMELKKAAGELVIHL